MKIEVPTKTLRTAEFKVWVPPNVESKSEKVRGVVVLTPGSNSDGTGYVRHEGWRKFATDEKLAIVGCYFLDKDPCGIEGYCKANEESGQSLLWAIREFSEKLKLPALDRVPLLLWGFSAGGQFNYEMNAAFPERVGAFVVNKGGIYYTALVSALARQTPGLFFIGTRDDTWRQDVVKGLVAVNRRGGARWRLIPENVGHDEGASEATSQQFFGQVLKEHWGE